MISERADDLIFDLELATELNHDGAIRQPRISARQELRDYIAELEGERRWIPVSERLPEDCERVWVRATNSPHNLPRRAFYTYRNGKWVNDEVNIDNVYSNLNVTHWMPMPEPPEAK